jgi:hypothetical protein
MKKREAWAFGMIQKQNGCGLLVSKIKLAK